VAILAAVLLAPVSALAQSAGGGAVAPTGPPAPSTGADPAGANPGAPPTAAGGTAAVSIAAAPPVGPNTLAPPPGGAMVGAISLVRGQLTPAEAGRPVVLSMLDAHRGWIPVAAAKAGAGGTFVVAWHARQVGRFLLRATSAGRHAVAPTAPVEVYRSVVATWFGPGSYGSRTACGQVMTPQLIGVAHRTLPCGTMVDIAYGSRLISVPVVDRGPFTTGVTFDLTAGTAQALGVSETVRIGAVVMRGTAASAP
jgi:hypothetical protein